MKFNSYRQELVEASFSKDKIEKVGSLVATIIAKDIGGQFFKLGVEKFKSPIQGSGSGIRFMNDKGFQLRFNWVAGDKSKQTISSVDFWNSKNKSFTKPSLSVKFSSELNIVQVVGELARVLKKGKVGVSKISMNESIEESIECFSALLEAKSLTDRKKWLSDNGLATSNASEENMRKRAGKVGLTAELEVFLGKDEINAFEDDLTSAKKELDQKVYADPETVFEDIEDVLSVVASGKWKTLVVCGQGGIGKTYHITEGNRSLETLLGPEGDKWAYHSGTKAAPYSFYKTLFQEREKIIVWDEADSLLKNKDIIMMLKPILDTSGSGFAEYMSGTQNMVGRNKLQIEEYCQEVDMEVANGKNIGMGKKDVKLPSKFQFTGGMVFISNMKSTEIEGAIMSRSIFIDVYLAESDVLKRIQSIGYAKAAKSADISKADIDEVMAALGASSAGETHKINYMTPSIARTKKSISVRALSLGLILKSSGLSRWEYLAAMYA